MQSLLKKLNKELRLAQGGFRMNWYEELKSYFPEEEMKSKAQLDCLLQEKADVYYKDEGTDHIVMYSEFPGFVYIDFLWVSEKSRGKGIGRKVIEKLKSKNKPIIIEVEPADENEPDTVRRLRFYDKLNFRLAESIDYLFQAFLNDSEVRLDIMYWADESMTEKEIFKYMNTVYQEIHSYKVEEFYSVIPKSVEKVVHLV